ncbi:MAG: alpha/beta hydrolase-fold protein [Paraglaciecola sp.]|uniref:alpha/beta hydrolase n=1 Tax=Paraglaciecola sp. TaxID=1920173 RepID=UPI00326456F4
MKVPYKLIFAVLLALFLCTSLLVYKRYLDDYTSDFIDHNIYSSVLGEHRKVFIRLPENYDKRKAYPLIVKSDGNFNLSRWDESVAELSRQNKVEDSIIVAIPNLFWVDARNRDLVPPYARKDVKIEARLASDNDPSIFGQANLFLAFIETEVLPFIETTYAINDNRVLSGFSAGGSFVLYAIVTKPKLFTGYFAFSPAAWYDESVVVREFKNSLSSTTGDPLFLYLSLGGAENNIITASFKGLLSAIQSNAPDNFYSAFSFSEDAEHIENPYVSVPKALEAYYEFRAENSH